MLKVNCEMTVQTIQRNAKTGKVVSRSKPQKNLIMDGGLNALARSTNATYPAEFANYCRVGSGSTADKVSSGAVTFTQAATTLTASAGFFTAGMVGWLFKWGSGTGGNEIYITGFTSSTIVTVGTSATVAVPAVGTVWNVTRSTLETLLYTNSSFEVTAGSCSTIISAPAVAHKRTYNFTQQVASYNVNEIGYFRASAGTTIFGRLVLGATEVVAPTNFLQVVLTFTVTYSPSAITAVADVGTNLNTAGNIMLEGIFSNTTYPAIGYVVTNSGSSSPSSLINGNMASLDGSNGGGTPIHGIVANYTQNAAIDAVGALVTPIVFAVPIFTYASVRGKMTATTNTTISTSGQTLYGVGIINQNGGSVRSLLDVKFTTPYVLPSGSFLPQVVFSCTYDRTLSN